MENNKSNNKNLSYLQLVWTISRFLTAVYLYHLISLVCYIVYMSTCNLDFNKINYEFGTILSSQKVNTSNIFRTSFGTDRCTGCLFITFTCRTVMHTVMFPLSRTKRTARTTRQTRKKRTTRKTRTGRITRSPREAWKTRTPR